jgi:hypothetical protein
VSVLACRRVPKRRVEPADASRVDVAPMDMPQQSREEPSPQTPHSRIVPRSARSKDGCATCKYGDTCPCGTACRQLTPHARRRKVKCDEQRPRCSHCERLNLECKWQPSSARRRSTVAGTPPVRAHGARASVSMTPGAAVISPTATLMNPPPHGVNQVFDYASFLWDGGDAWRPVSDVGATVSFEPQVVVSYLAPSSVITCLLSGY